MQKALDTARHNIGVLEAWMCECSFYSSVNVCTLSFLWFLEGLDSVQQNDYILVYAINFPVHSSLYYPSQLKQHRYHSYQPLSDKMHDVPFCFHEGDHHLLPTSRSGFRDHLSAMLKHQTLDSLLT